MKKKGFSLNHGVVNVVSNEKKYIFTRGCGHGAVKVRSEGRGIVNIVTRLIIFHLIMSYERSKEMKKE